MNDVTYNFVASILQTSQAHNVTIDGGDKYNIPSEEVTIDESIFAPQSLISHALEAISGADNFNDDNTTIREVFDSLVNNTREVTPTCEFSLFTYIYSFHLPSPNQVGSLWSLGYVQEEAFSKDVPLTIASSVTVRMDGRSIVLNGSPRSALSSSRTQFLSWEPPCVHPPPDLKTRLQLIPITALPRLTL